MAWITAKPKKKGTRNAGTNPYALGDSYLTVMVGSNNIVVSAGALRLLLGETPYASEDVFACNVLLDVDENLLGIQMTAEGVESECELLIRKDSGVIRSDVGVLIPKTNETKTRCKLVAGGETGLFIAELKNAVAVAKRPFRKEDKA